MLHFLGTILQFGLFIALLAAVALFAGAAFASMAKSGRLKWWATGTVLGGGIGSPYGEQGSQREASLRRDRDDDGDGSSDGGGGD